MRSLRECQLSKGGQGERIPGRIPERENKIQEGMNIMETEEREFQNRLVSSV